MDKDALEIIQKYKKNLNNKQRLERELSFAVSPYFKQLSYAKWAAEEIFKIVKRKKDTPASVLVEQFAGKMDMFSTYNLRYSFIFSVAKDTALDIYQLLLQGG